MQKMTIIASAAALFAAGSFAASAQTTQGPSGPGMVASKDCKGVNACKGQSACKSANNACKGQNTCKGQGWVSVSSAFECSALQSK